MVWEMVAAIAIVFVDLIADTFWFYRRKDDRRNSEYLRDGMHERRNGRNKREEGYYSD